MGIYLHNWDEVKAFLRQRGWTELPDGRWQVTRRRGTRIAELKRAIKLERAAYGREQYFARKKAAGG